MNYTTEYVNDYRMKFIFTLTLDEFISHFSPHRNHQTNTSFTFKTHSNYVLNEINNRYQKLHEGVDTELTEENIRSLLSNIVGSDFSREFVIIDVKYEITFGQQYTIAVLVNPWSYLCYENTIHSNATHTQDSFNLICDQYTRNNQTSEFNKWLWQVDRNGKLFGANQIVSDKYKQYPTLFIPASRTGIKTISEDSFGEYVDFDEESSGTYYSYYEGSWISTIIIDNGVVEIEGSAFFDSHWRSVKTIILPETIQRIHLNSFWGCNVKKVYFPNTAPLIHKHAFSTCPEFIMYRSVLKQ